MSPADVLDAAADYIDEYGWTQGEYRVGDACCAIGGVNEVTGYYSRLEMPPAEWDRRLAALIGLSRHVGVVSAWNDAPDQTAANVTATMRKVAADLRAETP